MIEKTVLNHLSGGWLKIAEKNRGTGCEKQ